MSGSSSFTYVLEGALQTSQFQNVNPGNYYEWTIPTGQMWKIRSCFQYITTSGTVGSRTLAVLIRDASSNNLWQIYGQGIAASGTGFTVFTLSSSQSVSAQCLPIPDVWLPAGYKFKAWDRANIDGAADVLQVGICYEVISVVGV